MRAAGSGTTAKIETMAGDFLRRAPQLTMEQFHAFRDERPKEEKWELIDGVPMMMPPPTLMHQRIAANLDRMLNAHLETVKPDWRADREVGVWLEGRREVQSRARRHRHRRCHCHRPDLRRALLFRSGSSLRQRPQRGAGGEARLLPAARAQSLRAVRPPGPHRRRSARPDRVTAAGSGQTLSKPEAPLTFPAIGTIGRLGELYKFTPLDPFARS